MSFKGNTVYTGDVNELMLSARIESFSDVVTQLGDELVDGFTKKHERLLQRIQGFLDQQKQSFLVFDVALPLSLDKEVENGARICERELFDKHVSVEFVGLKSEARLKMHWLETSFLEGRSFMESLKPGNVLFEVSIHGMDVEEEFAENSETSGILSLMTWIQEEFESFREIFLAEVKHLESIACKYTYDIQQALDQHYNNLRLKSKQEDERSVKRIFDCVGKKEVFEQPKLVKVATGEFLLCKSLLVNRIHQNFKYVSITLEIISTDGSVKKEMYEKTFEKVFIKTLFDVDLTKYYTAFK